jgi:hypothetical protein
MSISADGYVAGPAESEQHPLGLGGEALHAWDLGPDKDHPANRQVASDVLGGMGATIMGRNMFGPIRGEWGDSNWAGWWGDTPLYHWPVFILTHYPHDPIEPGQGGCWWTRHLHRRRSVMCAAGDRSRPGRRDRSPDQPGDTRVGRAPVGRVRGG